MSSLISNISFKESSGDYNCFKKKYSLQQREREFALIRSKYPTKIPTIVEPSNSKAPKINRNKFLLQTDLTVGQFIYMIRSRINLSPEESLFFFVNGKIPIMGALISDIYQTDRDEDGFLYFSYSRENVFG